MADQPVGGQSCPADQTSATLGQKYARMAHLMTRGVQVPMGLPNPSQKRPRSPIWALQLRPGQLADQATMRPITPLRLADRAHPVAAPSPRSTNACVAE